MTETEEIYRQRQEFSKHFSEYWAAANEFSVLPQSAAHLDVIEAFDKVFDKLAATFVAAEKTPGLDDNIDLEESFRAFRGLIVLKEMNGALTSKVSEYFEGYLIYLRVISLPQSSEVQLKLAQTALAKMTSAANTAIANGWPELQVHYDKAKAAIEALIAKHSQPEVQATKDKKSDLEGHEQGVLDLLDSGYIDWSKLKNEAQPDASISTLENNFVSAVHSFAEIVTRPTADNKLADDQIKVLQDALQRIQSDSRILRKFPEVTEQLRRLRGVVYRILHQDRVNKAGTSQNVEKYLRPSMGKVSEEVYGDVIGVLTEFGDASLDALDELGLTLSQAGDTHTALTDGQLRQLYLAEDRLAQLMQRYVTLREDSKDVIRDTDTTTTPYIQALTNEVNKYLKWLNNLMDSSERVVVTSTAPASKESADPNNYNLSIPNNEARQNEWQRFIESCETPHELEVSIRLIFDQIYGKEDLVTSNNLGNKDGRIEGTLIEFWKSHIDKLARGQSKERRIELFRIKDRYINMLRLFDGSVTYGNFNSFTADHLGNLDTLASNWASNLVCEVQLRYFLCPQKEKAEPGVDGGYDFNERMLKARFEHSKLVKWVVDRTEELLCEEPDLEDPYNKDNPGEFKKKGRFWAHNWSDTSAAARLDLHSIILEELKQRPDLGIVFDTDKYPEGKGDPATATLEEIFSIARAIDIFSGVRSDANAEVVYRGFSPRDRVAMRLNHINEFFPFAGANYSSYAAAKELEISMVTEIDHEIESEWFLVDDDDTSKNAGIVKEIQGDARKRWHRIEESFQGTRLFREQVAPYRKRWKVTHLEDLNANGIQTNPDGSIKRRRVLKAPIPTIYQTFVANPEYAEAKNYTLMGWVEAIKGSQVFHEIVLSEIKLEPGKDPDAARLELVAKLESALDTFSKIKNISVDWSYIAHMVLHLIDKLYVAYADVDKSEPGAERLYELIVEKFGLLTGRRDISKRLVSMDPFRKPEAGTYLKADIKPTFIEDGVEWMFTDYVITHLQGKGVYFEGMKAKKGSQVKVPPTPSWQNHGNELLRRQPWTDRTTTGILKKKAEYKLFLLRDPNFAHTVRRYGTGKSNTTKTATELKDDKKH